MEIESSNYGVYNTGTFTVSEGVTIDITSSLTGIYNLFGTYIINGMITASTATTNYYPFSNVGTTIVSETGTIVTTARLGIFNTEDGILTVNGTMVITCESGGLFSLGTINGTGTITVNGVPQTF